MIQAVPMVDLIFDLVQVDDLANNLLKEQRMQPYHWLKGLDLESLIQIGQALSILLIGQALLMVLLRLRLKGWWLLPQQRWVALRWMGWWFAPLAQLERATWYLLKSNGVEWSGWVDRIRHIRSLRIVGQYQNKHIPTSAIDWPSIPPSRNSSLAPLLSLSSLGEGGSLQLVV